VKRRRSRTYRVRRFALPVADESAQRVAAETRITDHEWTRVLREASVFQVEAHRFLWPYSLPDGEKVGLIRKGDRLWLVEQVR
jgi:hypothetical protein